MEIEEAVSSCFIDGKRIFFTREKCDVKLKSMKGATSSVNCVSVRPSILY